MDTSSLSTDTTQEVKTPIEIALNIDEDGKTTARALYEFLELAPQNYARWCKSNIVENDFAVEGEDYMRLAIDGESLENRRSSSMKNENYQPNPTQDYKLTAHFAKKLSMKGSGRKAELAREYFTVIEEKAKETVLNRSQLSPQTQLLMNLAESIAKSELEQKKQAERIDAIEKKQDAIQEACMPIHPDTWRRDVTLKFNKIQKKIGTPWNELYIEMYTELDRRAGVDTAIRLKNRRDRMRADGASKTRVQTTTRMDVIQDDKKLRVIFERILMDYELKYCV